MKDLISKHIYGQKKKLTLNQAIRILKKKFYVIAEKEYVSIKNINNRYLAEDIISNVNIPPANNTAVDGIAFKYSDLEKNSSNSIKLDGRVAAGNKQTTYIGKNKAVRIFTGALMPKGLDTVVMLENVKINNNEMVHFPKSIKKGLNVRYKGEDVKIKQKILTMGQYLRPQDISMLAATGNSKILVYKKIKIAVFSNGNELTEPKNKLSSGKIYDANRYMIISFLKKIGLDVSDLGIIADSYRDIDNIIKKTSKKYDLIISSGGMSLGEEDHIHKIIREKGELYFWQLAIKPGRPFGVGNIYSKPFIGLPGNPAAAYVTFILLAMPIISLLRGGHIQNLKRFSVISSFTHNKKIGRQEYLRGSVYKKNKHMYVKKYFKEGAGLVSSLVWSNGLIEIPSNKDHIKPGDKINFIPLDELFS